MEQVGVLLYINFLLLPRTDYNTGSSWGNSLNIPSTLCVFAL
uniref:Uncharacterized protein n=1 Tax=Anguilla anguilla TaxID=7936 RepID=A0A0E9PMF2_ANGAN